MKKTAKKRGKKSAKKTNPTKRTKYAYQVAEQNADGYFETYHKTRDDAGDYIEYVAYKRSAFVERDNFNDDAYFGEDSCGRKMRFFISKVPLKSNKYYVFPE